MDVIPRADRSDGKADGRSVFHDVGAVGNLLQGKFMPHAQIARRCENSAVDIHRIPSDKRLKDDAHIVVRVEAQQTLRLGASFFLHGTLQSAFCINCKKNN